MYKPRWADVRQMNYGDGQGPKKRDFDGGMGMRSRGDFDGGMGMGMGGGRRMGGGMGMGMDGKCLITHSQWVKRLWIW